MYKIEKNVSIPESRGGKTLRYPWRAMEVGDSFYVPVQPGQNIKSLQNSLTSSGSQALGAGCFATRIDGEGVRAWRIK